MRNGLRNPQISGAQPISHFSLLISHFFSGIVKLKMEPSPSTDST